jgi:hypothetical protein
LIFCANSLIRDFVKKEAPQTSARLWRNTGCLTSHFRLITRKNFEQVVFAVLFCKEKHGPVCPEFPRSNQTTDRAVSLGHVQPGRLVIFIGRHPIEAKRDESRHNVSVRMLAIQFVSPN